MGYSCLFTFLMANIRVREFDLGAGGFKAVTTDESALALVNRHTLENVSVDEVILRQMDLCHDQVDRTFERFPVAYLERFAATLPGKSVLMGHDYRTAPLGKFYDAAVIQRMQEHPVFTQPKGAFVEPVPGFEGKRRKVTLLDAGFYYPADEAAAALDTRIRTGVYNSVSVGFAYADLDCDICKHSYWRECPHIRGWNADREDPKSPIVTLTYSGTPEQIEREVEAYEGSIVYLGAQPNARIRKALMCQDGQVDVRALAETPYGTDLVALKEAEALARQFGHKQESWFFPAPEASPAPAGGDEMDLEKARKALGLAETATEDEILAAIKAARDAADQAGEQVKAADEKAAAAEQKATDAAAERDALKPKAAIGDQALADLKQAILDDDYRLTGKQENAELTLVCESLVERADYKRLRELAAQKSAQVLEKFPAGKSGDENAGGDAEPRAVAPAARAATDYPVT